VAEGIDLHHEIDFQAFLFSQVDEPIKYLFPVSVSSKVVIGDEECVDASFDMRPHNFFHVVPIAITRLLPLDIDDGAKTTGEWAAAPGIETTNGSSIPPNIPVGQKRDGDILQIGQVIEEIVDGLHLICIRIAK
jgi:hypothetical protein